MNTAIIMLGSNANAKNNLELSIAKLMESFDVLTKSLPMNTKPIGNQFSESFQNVAVKLMSKENLDHTIATFKQIEQEMGRKPDSKLTGIIPMDIDLIFWNDRLVHDDYNRFEYVKNCVNEIR